MILPSPKASPQPVMGWHVRGCSRCGKDGIIGGGGCGKLRGWRDVRNVDAKYVDGNGAMQITVPGHPYLPMVQAYATIALRPAYRFHGVQSAIKGGPLRPPGFCVSERERKRGRAPCRGRVCQDVWIT